MPGGYLWRMRCDSRLALLIALLVAGCGDAPEQPVVVDSGHDAAPMTPAPQAPPGITYPDGVFHATRGRFFVRFPVEPEYSAEQAASGVVTHLYVAAYNDSLACMVAHAAHPHHVVDQLGAPGLLARAAAGAAKPFGIVVEDALEPLTINGHPGLTFLGDGQGMYLQALFFLVNDRLYQLSLLGRGAHAPPEVAEAFFGSFHLEEEQGEPLEDWFPQELIDRAAEFERQQAGG